MTIIYVDAKHLPCSALLHLNRVESAIAADIEDAGAGEILRNRLADWLPLDVRKVTKKLIGRGVNSMKVEIVEPLTEFRDSLVMALSVDFIAERSVGGLANQGIGGGGHKTFAQKDASLDGAVVPDYGTVFRGTRHCARARCGTADLFMRGRGNANRYVTSSLMGFYPHAI